MSDNELNFHALLHTPTPMDDDILELEDGQVVDQMDGEQEGNKEEGEAESSSSSGAPPSNQKGLEPEKQKPERKSTSSTSSESSASEQMRKAFMDQVLAIGQPQGQSEPYQRFANNRVARRPRPNSGGTYPTGPALAARGPIAAQRARNLSPTGTANTPKITMSSMLKGREDLLLLASQEVAGRQVYPLLQAYLANENSPKTPKEASMKAIWDVNRPRINAIVIMASFSKDPVQGYNRAYQIPLINPRSIDTVVTKLTESSEVILSLLYSLHAERTLLTPATTNFMLTNRHVIQRDAAFYHLHYPSVDDRFIGRDEALMSLPRVELKTFGRHVHLVVHLRLYGPTHRCNTDKAVLQASTEFLLWNKADREKHAEHLRNILNE